LSTSTVKPGHERASSNLLPTIQGLFLWRGSRPFTVCLLEPGHSCAAIHS
jgi:hypothetical protein